MDNWMLLYHSLNLLKILPAAAVSFVIIKMSLWAKRRGEENCYIETEEIAVLGVFGCVLNNGIFTFLNHVN